MTNPERQLRALWTEQGVPADRQDELIREIEDKAKPGAAVGPFRIPVDPPYKRWRHPPGCPDSDWCSGNSICFWDCQGDPDAGIDDNARSPAQRRADARLLAPKPQQPCDVGLFSDDRDQLDLVDLSRRQR